MPVQQLTRGVLLPYEGCFDADKTFDCGQCFRFAKTGAQTWAGVAMGQYIEVENTPEGVLVDGIADEQAGLWAHFLALDCDYAQIDRRILEFMPDKVTAAAVREGQGIRILRQDPWEALCSFIVSQNNNIPRIKKIIVAMCERFGDSIGGGNYSFPGPEILAYVGVDEIFALRTGFRAAYIWDAAKKVSSGEISLDDLRGMPYNEASQALCQIKGVGPKVAACTLLYGFGKTEAFPVDVWIRRVIDEYYSGSLDAAKLGAAAGIFQQYLFWYIRNLQ